MSTVGASAAIAFRELHHRPGAPLLLPNAWDHASATALAAAGFPAVGTTSLGVAAAAGLPDGAGRTRAETLRLARRIGGELFLLPTYALPAVRVTAFSVSSVAGNVDAGQ
ncbi:isocitrate lyase/phosphoenolpyruvate mutase family protein [Embleya sp. AB8]|uniref:isocitrate lyase/phosphoenolpyruvate mutase family protein n=1 Tax=Embleya sp. AB8 TaxID=3156304 RepID=UPI003C779DED